ncbi:MAG: hypothetical protein Q9221_003009 [Calogaya cf. arnoldii]
MHGLSDGRLAPMTKRDERIAIVRKSPLIWSGRQYNYSGHSSLLQCSRIPGKMAFVATNDLAATHVVCCAVHTSIQEGGNNAPALLASMVARHGLTELYEPPEGTATVALIIFVHGLFGHPYHTWASQPSSSRSTSPRQRATVTPRKRNGQEPVITPNTAQVTVLWPRDLLPNLVHDARIFTWGYDADIDGLGSASQSTIHQHAGSLLSDIADQREISGYRQPILFVVHSLGGIIVKAALNRSLATQGTRLKDIAPATFGVCFLGTPHRGSNSASLGKIAYEITRAMTRRPNTRLLQGLERNSETLEQIGDTFIQTMLALNTKLRVYSFREEKETRKYWVFNTMVVEPDSAKIGDPHEEVGSIPANHSQMTKFETSEDIGFKRVAAQLRRWVHELRVTEEISPADIADCMDSLSILETKSRILNVHEAYKATFHWLFDRDVVPFTHWLSHGTEENQPFFWIQGKPGSGKSTLIKFAMRDPRTLALLGETSDSETQWALVAFFFHDRGSSIQKSLLGLLREIVDSTLRQLPQLMPYAIAVYKDLVKSQRNRLPAWNFEALRSVMERITGQREARVKLLLFLDALDEHEGDNELLLQLLKEWTHNVDGYYVTLKICLASRSWPVFSQQFDLGPNFAIDKFTKDDIRVYTESRLNSCHVGSIPLPETERLGFLMDQITTKAKGVFIWVRLVTDRLASNFRDGTPLQVLSRIIAETPEELQELYDDTLRRIDPEYANETHVMFQMVLYSLEPLPLQTLLNATTMSLDRYLDDSSIRYGDAGRMSSRAMTDDRVLRWLMSRSGGLLETYIPEANFDHLGEAGTSTAVQFLHQTSKEYIESTRAQAVMDRMAPRVASKDGYYFLALASGACSVWIAPIKLHMLYYIKLTELHNQIDEQVAVPFRPNIDTANHATHPCGFQWWLQQQEEPMWKSLYQGYLSASGEPVNHYLQLCTMVAANLISIFPKTFPPRLRQFKEEDFQSETICLLQIAIGGPNIVPAELQDRTAMVKKILAFGYRPNTRKMIPSPLARPYTENHVDNSLKAVLQGSALCTPIHYLLRGLGKVQLTQETRITILEALLEAGAEVNSVLVSYCAQHEGAEILRLLLQRGAPMNERESGWLPIDYALLRGNREILAVFNEFLSEPLRPNIIPRTHQNNPAELVRQSTTIYTAIGHPGLAMLLARCEYQEFKARVREEEDRLHRQTNPPGPYGPAS